MTTVVEDDGTNGFDTTEEALTRLRHRLFDVASELRPLTTVEELGDRVRAVASELHGIERELLLIVHIQWAASDGLFDKLQAIDAKLAEGWQPDGSDADDVVTRLRSQL